jgi:spore maturation protein CgeB
MPFYNSIVLESSDAQEIEDSVTYLEEHPAEAAMIRQNAKDTARYFTWERVIRLLVRKIEAEARAQGLIEPSKLPDVMLDVEQRFENELVAVGGK